MTTPTAFLMRWYVTEAKWGECLNGYSLHTSPQEYELYSLAHHATFLAPEKLSHPGGELIEVEISAELAAELTRRPSLHLDRYDLNETPGRTKALRVARLSTAQPSA